MESIKTDEPIVENPQKSGKYKESRNIVEESL